MIQNSPQILADIPVPEKLIQIENFQVFRNDTLKIGDTLIVLLDFSAKVNCDVAVSIPVRGGLTLLGDTNTNFTYTQTVNVERDSLNYVSLKLIVGDTIASFITASVSIVTENKYFNSPIGFTINDVVSKNIEIQPFNPNCSTINNYDETCKNYIFTKETFFSTRPNEKRFVNITGSILYYDHYAPHEGEVPDIKGAFTNVWLFFYRNSAPNKLYHPVPFDNNNMPSEGIHYFRTDHNGVFSFNFGYLLDSLVGQTSIEDWGITLIVAKENEALQLYSNTNNILVHGINNPDRSSSNIKCFHRLLLPKYDTPFSLNSPIFVWNVGNVFFKEFGSSDREGAIFRHTTLSRKFLIERLEIDESNALSMSINIPQQVEVVEEFAASNYNRFSNGKIWITSKDNSKRSDPTSNLIAHEWGHYYHSFLGFKGTGTIVQEGWALFFANAMMNWAENKYGDQRNYIDDLEMGPFLHYVASFKYLEGDVEKHKIENYDRFGNVSKTSSGFSTGHYDMSRFACYLWNIYDSSEDGSFIRPIHEGYENDDVQGLGKEVFECFIEYNRNFYNLTYTDIGSPSGFNNLFQDFVAPISDDSKEVLRSSIQKIYNCMDFQDENLKLNILTKRMAPPIIKLESVNMNGENSTAYLKSNTYPPNIGVYNLRWFTSTTDTLYHIVTNFSNKEKNILVYNKSHEGDWEPYNLVDDVGTYYEASLDKPVPAEYRFYTLSYIWNKELELTREYFSYGVNPEITITQKSILNDYDGVLFADALLFPNPNRGSLSIKSSKINNKYLRIRITDLNGRVVLQTFNTSSNQELNVVLPAAITNGIYLIEIIDNISNELLVKNLFSVIQ